MNPSRNANVTARECAVCAGPLPAAGRTRRWCSNACRQAAFRARHSQPVSPPALPAKTARRPHTIYQCPDCETRLLGTQQCPDCGTFMTRIGLGGLSPCCDEPITFEELLDN